MDKSKLNDTILQIIAYMSMIIDHLGILISRLDGFNEYSLVPFSMRCIGRIAMPIFAYMLVNGFYKTHNKQAYFFRLLIIGLISEIPYDLFIKEKLFSFDSQNIILAFAFLFLMIWLIELIKSSKNLKIEEKLVLITIVFLVFVLLCTILKFDYLYILPIIVFIMTMTRKNKMLMAICSYAFIVFESFFLFKTNIDILNVKPIFTIFSFVFIYISNGQRNQLFNNLSKQQFTQTNSKYLFYLIYPIHYLLLVCLAFLAKNPSSL